MVHISQVVFTPAMPADRVLGLMGWVHCVLGGAILLDAIPVRRSLDGRLVLSFPRRVGRHYFHRPLNGAARAEIERQILDAIASKLEAVS